MGGQHSSLSSLHSKHSVSTLGFITPVSGPKYLSSSPCESSSLALGLPLNSALSTRFFLEGTAAAYAFSTPEGDLPAAVAVAWSLWAIWAHQKSGSGFVRWTSLVFAILALVWVLKGAYGLCVKTRGGRIVLSDEERAPLVGSS